MGTLGQRILVGQIQLAGYDPLIFNKVRATTADTCCMSSPRLGDFHMLSLALTTLNVDYLDPQATCTSIKPATNSGLPTTH